MMAYSLEKQPFPAHPKHRTGRHPGFKDLTGMGFGRLSVMHYAGSQHSGSGKRRYPIWACQCSCGQVVGVWSASLLSGHTQSCGCLQRDVTSAANSANLEGEIFSRLEVIGRVGSKDHAVMWRCKCDCGQETIVSTENLKAGSVQSCGCLQAEVRTAPKTHGMSRSPEHIVWKGMRARCLNAGNPAYANYGGRGITISDDWSSFEKFFSDMGPRPSLDHSLDRIDNDGPYSAENCRWATASEQAKNRRPHTYGRERGDDGQFKKSKGVSK